MKNGNQYTYVGNILGLQGLNAELVQRSDKWNLRFLNSVRSCKVGSTNWHNDVDADVMKAALKEWKLIKRGGQYPFLSVKPSEGCIFVPRPNSWRASNVNYCCFDKKWRGLFKDVNSSGVAEAYLQEVNVDTPEKQIELASSLIGEEYSYKGKTGKFTSIELIFSLEHCQGDEVVRKDVEKVLKEQKFAVLLYGEELDNEYYFAMVVHPSVPFHQFTMEFGDEEEMEVFKKFLDEHPAVDYLSVQGNNINREYFK